MIGKRIVLDANILLRGVPGIRVLELLTSYEDVVEFHSPENCFAEAGKHVRALAASRDADPASGLLLLERIADMVAVVDLSFYGELEETARARISSRDPTDWPVVAASLLLNCPVWTEDQDFFGSGVATWTTATIEQYLRSA